MLPILTPEESAALDRESAARGVATDTLMARAGWQVARAAASLVGGAYGRRAVVVCGKGNNGGDGLVAARHLRRWGMGVEVLLLADPGALRGAAAGAFRAFSDTGGRWRRFDPTDAERRLARADLAVDAIFGTGFRGAAGGAYGEAITLLGRSGLPVVAVDIPSGVEGETGAVRGPAVRAELTVTLGALKPGVVFEPGASRAGRVEVVDIGFPPDLVRSEVGLLEADDVRALVPPLYPEAHKRSRGTVLVLAGSRGMTGAPVLAASAAYRAGAGLVTLAVPEGILRVVQSRSVETTFLPLPETESGSVSDRAWPLLAERLEEVGAVAVGPGLGTDPATVELVRRVVAEAPPPVVLDADGLNAFAGRGGLLAERGRPMVLTPHAGEAGRLLGLPAGEVSADRMGAVRKAALEFRCPVLLKGPRTLVADPSGRVAVNPTGGPSLATGGTGDVLTGVVAALAAQGLGPFDAAVAGAYLHGAAGDLAGAELERGTVASDLLDRLPVVLAALGGRAG